MTTKEATVIILAFIALAAGLLGGLGYANHLMNKSACEQFSRRAKRIVTYEWPSGCYVFDKAGNWVPLNSIKDGGL